MISDRQGMLVKSSNHPDELIAGISPVIVGTICGVINITIFIGYIIYALAADGMCWAWCCLFSGVLGLMAIWVPCECLMGCMSFMSAFSAVMDIIIGIVLCTKGADIMDRISDAWVAHVVFLFIFAVWHMVESFIWCKIIQAMRVRQELAEDRKFKQKYDLYHGTAPQYPPNMQGQQGNYNTQNVQQQPIKHKSNKQTINST
jgi:hypothetical protein